MSEQGTTPTAEKPVKKKGLFQTAREAYGFEKEDILDFTTNAEAGTVVFVTKAGQKYRWPVEG